jgi:hypothetical protein
VCLACRRRLLWVLACVHLQSLRVKVAQLVVAPSAGGAQAPPPPAWRDLVAAVLPVPACDPTVGSGAQFTHPSERALAVAVVQLPEVVEHAVTALLPHVLCDHMHTLAGRFHSFYAACRVVPEDGALRVLPPADAATFARRVALCAAADDALRTGMGLLGITPPDRL